MEIDLSRVQTKAVAAVLGLSVQHVVNLHRQGVIHQTAKGKYDLAEAVQAYVRHRAGLGTTELASEGRRLKAAQATRFELENKRRAGELLQRDEAVEAASLALQTIRAGALALPARVSHRVANMDDVAEIRELVRAEVIEFLNDAASKLSKLGLDQPRRVKRKTKRRTKRKAKAVA